MSDTQKPEFLVVIPSIRQSRTGFDEVQSRVRASFSRPTEYHLLDGKEGKPAALNFALASLLPPSEAKFYVTMDDDYVPGAGWQDLIVKVFESEPKIGVIGLWVSDNEEHLRIIGAERVSPPRQSGSATIRLVDRGHHIAGALLAYRREVAEQIGAQPITGEKYQVWEDAWRGRRAQSLGWDLAFVEGAEPEYIKYDDPPEYDAWRAEQVALSRKNQDEWLRDSGIPDPWHLRLRRVIARLRGRAKD